jgi:serine/threonine-protein kinase
MTDTADRHLLFGLLALQNGLINQGQLLGAFQAWTLDKSKRLAEYLEARGDLTASKRALLEALAEVHLEAHGGNVEQSLAAVPAGKSTRAGLAQLGDPNIVATLGHVASGLDSTGNGDSDQTVSYSVGAASSDGQRFRVLRPHARGGLGAVFVALDSELNREVALKQIVDRYADDPVSRQRFLLEAEVTGGLEHPGIVPVYGLGSYASGRPFYAMRFIRGDSLKEAIQQFHADAWPRKDPGRRSLELRKLLRQFLDVCNAIDYAHSRGVLHRDIKPGNVIVGTHGETLVVDWGLAKPLGRVEPGIESGERTLLPLSGGGSASTLPGSALGTPGYMSPEQAQGDLENLGPRTDVYSLGATLYCLVTGKPPFEGDIADVIRLVQKGQFLRPRQLDPSIDRALESICLKAMAQSPPDRYSSARALADDVERWMADEAVSAWREPWTRTLMRWLTRHRVGVTAAGAAALVALAGTAAVLGVQTRANAALSAANVNLAVANSKVTSANADLAAANERERARFELAQEAIRTFHTGVSKDVLLKQDEFKALRTKLLRGARAFYHKLEALLQGHEDRESRLALGRAYLEVGDLTLQLESIDESKLVLRRALNLFEALCRENPADEASQHALALADRALWMVSGMVGQSDEGFAAVTRSSELFRKLATAHPADRQLRKDWAESERLVAVSLDIRNRHTEAIEAIERARSIYETRGKEDSTRDGPELGLQEIHAVRAMLLNHAGRRDEAISAYVQARELGEQLFRASPDDPEIGHELARTTGNMGVFLSTIGRRADALACFERALEVLKAAGGANPNTFLFPAASAWMEFARGIELIHLGRDDEALEALGRARAAREILMRANPAVVRNRSQLSGIHLQISGVHRRAGRMPQALESLERARDLAASLVRSHPAEPGYQSDLAWVYAEFGELHATQHHIDQVLSWFDQALRIARHLAASYPATPSLQSELGGLILRRGVALERCGRFAQAVSDFRESIAVLRGLKSPSPSDHVAIAQGLSRLFAVSSETASGLSAADGRAAADDAIKILRETAAAGWRDVALLRDDPDLAPLRSRPDFQSLALDMDFPASPFAAATQ